MSAFDTFGIMLIILLNIISFSLYRITKETSRVRLLKLNWAKDVSDLNSLRGVLLSQIEQNEFLPKDLKYITKLNKGIANLASKDWTNIGFSNQLNKADISIIAKMDEIYEQMPYLVQSWPKQREIFTRMRLKAHLSAVKLNNTLFKMPVLLSINKDLDVVAYWAEHS